MSDRVLAVTGLVVSSLGLAWCLWVMAMVIAEGPKPKPAPTPAACCNSKECRQGFAQVDARFGDVWDELVEVQEQLAKVKACCCGPSKSCECSEVATCECKSQLKAQLPKQRIFKRCK